MEKWEDWRIGIQFSHLQSVKALCWPLTGTMVLPGGDPGEYKSWNPMEIGLNDKSVKKGLTLDSALCWPLTSTTVFGGGGLPSSDPGGERLTILNFARITLTLVPGGGAGDSMRPVGGLQGCRVQPIGHQDLYGQPGSALAGGLERGWEAAASVATASSSVTVAATSHPQEPALRGRTVEEFSLRSEIKLKMHKMCEEKSRDEES